MLHRVALRAKGRIAQPWATILVRRAITKATAAVTTMIARATIARTATASITTAAISALTRARTTARGRWCVFLHARTIVATHGHHGTDGLRRRLHRGCRRRFNIPIGNTVYRRGFVVCRRRFAATGRYRSLVGLRHRCGCVLLTLVGRGSRLRRLGLAAQSSFQGLHGRADLLRISGHVGDLKRLGRLQHNAVARAQFGHGLFTVGRLAIEGFVDWLAEGIPQFLFVFAVQRHGLGLGLPALL
ncbi:hypothetical protein D3C71_1542660 [compost metagenome]